MSWIRIGALACALLGTPGSQARDIGPLTFAEAAQRVLQAHPQFERFALASGAAQARAAAAAQRPPLELAGQIENAAGSDRLRGIQSAETTLSIAAVLERGDKRAARVAVAERAAELLSLEQRSEALELLAETGRRFVDLAAAQEALARAQERAAQARQTLELIGPRVAAARSPPTERLNAEIDVAEAELATARAQRELEAARLALAAQWGEPTELPTAAIALYELPEPRAFEALARELERLPDLERYAAEARLRDAQLRLAQAQAGADWRFSAGVRRLEEIDEQALVLGFSVPLGTARREAPRIREAELEQAQVSLAAEALRLKLLPLLHAQWQLLQSARQAEHVIATEQLPRAREALELTERGYRIGRFPYRELAIAQQQLLALQARRLAAAAQYHRTRIEIERLTGARLALFEGPTP